MTTLPSRIIPITNDRAQVLVPDDAFEPEPGSVVLMNGQWGQAWQRQFDTGMWNCASGRGGRGKTWEWLLTKRNLVLVYDAAVR